LKGDDDDDDDNGNDMCSLISVALISFATVDFHLQLTKFNIRDLCKITKNRIGKYV